MKKCALVIIMSNESTQASLYSSSFWLHIVSQLECQVLKFIQKFRILTFTSLSPFSKTSPGHKSLLSTSEVMLLHSTVLLVLRGVTRTRISLLLSIYVLALMSTLHFTDFVWHIHNHHHHLLIILSSCDWDFIFQNF